MKFVGDFFMATLKVANIANGSPRVGNEIVKTLTKPCANKLTKMDKDM